MGTELHMGTDLESNFLRGGPSVKVDLVQLAVLGHGVGSVWPDPALQRRLCGSHAGVRGSRDAGACAEFTAKLCQEAPNGDTNEVCAI